MNNISLYLTVFSLLVLVSGFSYMDNADATKSSGTSLSKTLADNICGDDICSEKLTTEQKIGYYLMRFIEVNEDTAIQQSRFQVGGVAMQALGGNFASGGEIKFKQMPQNSLIKAGISKSFALPIETPRAQLTGSAPSIESFNPGVTPPTPHPRGIIPEEPSFNPGYIEREKQAEEAPRYAEEAEAPPPPGTMPLEDRRTLKDDTVWIASRENIQVQHAGTIGAKQLAGMISNTGVAGGNICVSCIGLAQKAQGGPIDPDPDGDLIQGKQDNCPNEPETWNNYQDRDGCPDEAPFFEIGFERNSYSVFDTVTIEAITNSDLGYRTVTEAAVKLSIKPAHGYLPNNNEEWIFLNFDSQGKASASIDLCDFAAPTDYGEIVLETEEPWAGTLPPITKTAYFSLQGSNENVDGPVNLKIYGPIDYLNKINFQSHVDASPGWTNFGGNIVHTDKGFSPRENYDNLVKNQNLQLSSCKRTMPYSQGMHAFSLTDFEPGFVKATYTYEYNGQPGSVEVVSRVGEPIIDNDGYTSNSEKDVLTFLTTSDKNTHVPSGTFKIKLSDGDLAPGLLERTFAKIYGMGVSTIFPAPSGRIAEHLILQEIDTDDVTLLLYTENNKDVYRIKLEQTERKNYVFESDPIKYSDIPTTGNDKIITFYKDLKVSIPMNSIFYR